MSITAYNTTYCDDVNVPDSNGKSPLDKNYLRILFKPGYAVQTRELNQLQSLIQAQLDRVGDSIYRSGKPVIDGRARFDDQLEIYSVNVKVNPGYSDIPAEAYSSYNRITRTTLGTNGNTSLRAKVVLIQKLDGEGNYKLFIKNKNSETDPNDTNTNITKYTLGDTLSIDNSEDESVQQISLDVTSVNNSVGAHIAKGVYFIKGCYAVVNEQYIATDITSDSSFTGYVVLKVSEGIATSQQVEGQPLLVTDETLLDNAQGYLNYSADGADRYFIDLTLELLSGTDIPSDDKYITLLQIVDDKVTTNYSEAEFTGIDDKLAKRTYEESGNYEVNPFPIHIREAYNDSTNGGLYTDSVLAENGYPNADAAKSDLICTLDPSVAYVKGYRVQLTSSVPLKFSKARETATLLNAGVSADMGTYVDGTFDADASNIPNIENVATVYTLKNSGTTIGTAKIRSIESNGGSSYRLFLYDIALSGSDQIQESTKLVNGSTFSFTSDTVLKNTDVGTSLYELPIAPIKNISDVQIIKKKLFDNVPVTKTLSTDTTGTLTISVTDTNSVFDKSPSNIIVCVNGTKVLPQSAITVGITDSNTLTLSLTELPSGTVTARVITSVSATAKRGVKQLKTATVTLPSPTTIGSVKYYTLSGIYHLVSVSSDVFTVDSDGQHDSHYAEAIIKTSASSPPATVTVTYYDFTTSDAVYYDALSYKKEENVGGVTSVIQVPLEEIPSYKDYALINVLDFRYVLSGSILSYSPIDAYSPITFDAEYYIPRIDSVVVNKTGSFSIIKGIASVDPKKPLIPDNSMELYTLNIAPYTFGPSDVNVEKIDNKRYTMSNIRALERRISNLEYYTTLSFLEKNANDTSILDDVGINRFKNGFIVDNFIGHNVSDPTEGNSVCAIDPAKNECRPAFSTESIKLEKSNTVEVTPDNYFSGVHDRSITLPYTKEVYIAQTAASEYSSIVPFDSATAVGKLNLYPSSDYWCETVQLKPSVVQNDSLKDAFTNFVTGLESELGVDILGTEWRSWRTYWRGNRPKDLAGNPISTQSSSNPLKKFNWNFKKEIRQFRNGVTTSIGTNDSQLDLGERVVDLSVRPYIRRRYIYFSADALKPNTVYYPFFDTIDVSAYCHVLTKEEFDSKKNTDVVGPYLPEILTSEGSQILKTDENGHIYGVFVIPDFAATGIKFLTGERQFKLTDSVRNNSSEVTSYASSNYVASGMAKTMQSTILSTAVPELVRTPVKEERKLSSAFAVNNNNGGCGYQDPVAQSFLISNDEGIFAAGIDIYFAKKSSTNTPVEIYIVSCENGNPTQNVIPLSTVVKDAGDVITDINGQIPTYFEFEQPVYLSPYQEYAVVCKSTDADYMVFTATMGKPNINNGGQTITKNPYMGVFFKSQNSFTWSPEQTIDLTFTLYRAKFVANSQRDVVFNTPSLRTLKRIKITNPGSGYTSLPTVIISGGGGSGAAAYAVSNDNGGIREIVLTDRGSGYTSIPTVELSDGNATAEAVMGNYQVSNFVLDQDTVEISISNDIYSTVTNRINILGTTYQAVADTTYEAYGSKQEWSEDANAVNRNNMIELTSTLYSTSDYLTPVIDTDRMNVKLIRNNIRLDSTNTSRYVTRIVKLAEKADQVDIYFDVNRPSVTCDLKVYVEYDNSGTWVEILTVDPKTIPVNSNLDSFSEVHYTGSTTNEFDSFRVKIEFIGSNIVDIPRIANFRAIATI